MDLTGLEENPYLTCLDDQERCVRAVRELMDRMEEKRQKILVQGNREAVSEQELFQNTKALHWEQMPSALSDYPVDLLGVDPDHEGERFLRAVQEGTVDREAFRRGEECILYLPAVSKEPWNDTGAEEGAPDYWSAVGGTHRFSTDLYALGEENPNPAKGIALIGETSVQPGESSGRWSVPTSLSKPVSALSGGMLTQLYGQLSGIFREGRLPASHGKNQFPRRVFCNG